MRLFSTIALLSVLTSCSLMGGDTSDNYHWQSESDGKHDERTEQERMEHDLSQCVAGAHGFNVDADQCMQGRGYTKHFD